MLGDVYHEKLAYSMPSSNERRIHHARRISYEVRLFQDVKMNEFRVEIVWPGLVATLSLDLHASLNIQIH